MKYNFMKKSIKICKKCLCIFLCAIFISIFTSCSSESVKNGVSNVISSDTNDASETSATTTETNDVENKLQNITIDTNKGDIFNSDKTEKPMFINFWATWCGPCVGEMGEIQSTYEEYKDKVDFIMINCGESKDTIEGFLVDNKGAYTFPIGYDEDGAVSEKFSIMAIPTTYIVDKNKNISKKIVGSSTAETFKAEIEKVIK